MNTSQRKQYRFATLRAAILLLAALAATPQSSHAAAPVTDDTLSEALASATTAADHEALAAYFRSKAEEETKRIERHEAMLAGLEGKGKVYANFLPHCRSIISSARQAKKAYEKMAEDQAALAKAAAQ